MLIVAFCFYKTAFISPNNPNGPNGQQIHSLLSVFNVVIHEISWKLDKSSIKTWRICTFWSFCQFWSEFGLFSLENCVDTLTKASRTMKFFLVELLYYSESPSFSKIRQKLHEIIYNLNFLGFLSISVWIWGIFSKQISFISSKKPLGQQIFSLLNVFNFLRLQVYQKFDKNCKKKHSETSFSWNFIQIRSQFQIFFIEKLHYFFKKASRITKFFPFERFQHSKPQNLLNIWQTLHKNVENRKTLQCSLFLGSLWVTLGSLESTKKSKNLYKYIPHDTNLTSVGFYGWNPLAWK